MSRVRGSFRWIMLLLTTLPPGLHASVDDPIEKAQFRVVGAGQLTWWGNKVYDAVLYAPDGSYHPDHPHAIKITYRLSFSQEQLASKSLQEIERIFGAQPGREERLRELQAVFRDVTRGDHILGVHYPGKGAEFYSENVMLGRLENVKFAEAFFSIWLDPATREPDLRAQLLGYRQ